MEKMQKSQRKPLKVDCIKKKIEYQYSKVEDLDQISKEYEKSKHIWMHSERKWLYRKSGRPWKELNFFFKN